MEIRNDRNKFGILWSTGMKKRNVKIDVIRGVAILFVMLGHSIYTSQFTSRRNKQSMVGNSSFSNAAFIFAQWIYGRILVSKQK